MDDKGILLKQIGWSDELIYKCLSGKNLLEDNISLVNYYVPVVSEQDTTNLTVDIDTPTISDGTHIGL